MSRKYIIPDQIAISNPATIVTPTSQNVSSSPPMAQQQQQQQQQQIQPQEIVFPYGNPNVLSPPAAISPSSQALPPYFRSITSSIPKTNSVQKSAGVPLGLIISPALVTNAPVIDESQGSVIRCTKCSGYLSPYTRFEPNSDLKSYICPMCKTKNTVPTSTYSQQPLMGRLEFMNPVYDYIATPNYVVLPNFRPTFVIICDISIPARICGFTQHFLTSIKTILPSVNPNIYINLITIADKTIVYDFVQQREIVLPDPTDIAIPNIKPAKIGDVLEKLTELLNELIEQPPSPTATGHSLPTALLVAEQMMAGLSGILFIGCVNIPSLGPYKLAPRNVSQTDELSLLKLNFEDPNSKFFRDISFRLSKVSASYHLFIANSETYSNNSGNSGGFGVDLGTLGVPAGLTGGSVYYYSNNSLGALGDVSLSNAAKMHVDLFNAFTKEYYFNASLRLRCTKGLKVAKVHGNFIVTNKDLIGFPVLTPEKSVSYELNVDPEVRDGEDALFQLALLWTTIDCRRMIRVFTFRLPVTLNPNQIRAGIDEGCLTALEAKRAVFSILSAGRDAASTNLRKSMNGLMTTSNATTSNAIMTTSVRSMYHLSHAIAVSPIMCLPCENGADGRMETAVWVRSANIVELLLWLYPRMFTVDTSLGPLPLCAESFGLGNVFLFHTDAKIYFWISNAAEPNFLRAAFGTDKTNEIPAEVPNLQTEENQRIQAAMNECWNLSGKYLPNEVITQGSQREMVISKCLIDSSPTGDIKSWINILRGA